MKKIHFLNGRALLMAVRTFFEVKKVLYSLMAGPLPPS